jgi:hypothetical protein
MIIAKDNNSRAMLPRVTLRLFASPALRRQVHVARNLSVSNSCSQAASNKNKDGGNRLDLSGVLPPIPTPFNARGDVAYDKLEQNFGIWRDAPFKGLNKV